eukprot:gnl/TRDRNA2_/TRDRNA2_171993_c3_seq10.p1 gnl/TRDRNA2_/TRDRNA2_171993_c3~~gnl/TRDRNA2_/TRDRNA2_171993_c3_seq10.p1  ORF type:complete len:396 (+),score=124.03 gnl/TRDRNA2_/TRDRNA2_171993_c3_seq10:384-1571(+)
MKLFDTDATKEGIFTADTRYVIMFGPDKCGSTDKVHFILQHKNPKSGEWEEKHFKDAPSVPFDKGTHLYTLIIKPDNSFDIQVDGKSKATGNLLTSMTPSINPPKEIDDPEDSKPSDWVDEAKIDDPEASKPDDWDEDAPARIKDPDAKMPDGWNEDAEKKIPDPSAKQPEDWDAEEDGDWEAPIIDNPACKVGCGKWEPPMIANPKYKGKWFAPKIDNPAYKGVWKARQIANPNFFEDETPAILPKIDSVGIDIWTMQGGILFDNVLVSSSVEKASEFTEQTFKLRSEIEKLQAPPPPSMGEGTVSKMIDGLKSNPIPAAVTAVTLLITMIWMCCCRGEPTAPAAPTKAERKEMAKKASGDGDEKKEESKEEKKEKKEEKKQEGGLGDLASKDD